MSRVNFIDGTLVGSISMLAAWSIVDGAHVSATIMVVSVVILLLILLPKAGANDDLLDKALNRMHEYATVLHALKDAGFSVEVNEKGKDKAEVKLSIDRHRLRDMYHKMENTHSAKERL